MNSNRISIRRQFQANETNQSLGTTSHHPEFHSGHRIMDRITKSISASVTEAVRSLQRQHANLLCETPELHGKASERADSAIAVRDPEEEYLQFGT